MIEVSDSLDVTNRILKRRLKILNLLTEKPLWKKRTAEKLDDSPQTIGRDIDTLHEDGLLEYTLIGAEHDNRTHYIGYETTEPGKQALADYRICVDCGEVVEPAKDCVHDYTPIAETTSGGGS